MVALHLEDFEVLQLLGTSSHSSCYKVRNVNSNEILVWKVLHVGSLSLKKKQVLEKEAHGLRIIAHENIVMCYNEIVNEQEGKLNLFTEYSSEGNVASLINSCKRSSTFVNEHWIWQVLYELCGALKACEKWAEKATFLCFNVKPSSVFLDISGSVKLGNIDLKNPADYSHDEPLDSTNILYMSPELLKGEVYSTKCDMWALGCVIYELCALTPPFSATTYTELKNKVDLGRYERIPSHFSDDLSRVLASLLTRDPMLRPSPSDLVTDSTVLAHVVESVSMDEYVAGTTDTVEAIEDSGISKDRNRRINSKVPPTSPADPDQVSTETFRTEWLHRLEAIRQREAKVRDREAAVQERERHVSRREYKVTLLEKAVKDKLTRAEIYLKRCRESRAPGTQRARPQMPATVDESFSADPGDTSVLPTMTRLNPTQVSRPTLFSDRKVHFNQTPWSGTGDVPFVEHKSKCTIVGAGAQLIDEAQVPKSQKVLKLPGYTGPPLMVDLPSSDNAESRASSSASSLQNPQSPTTRPDVELKVLFDDRPFAVVDHMRRVSTMASQLEALNLEMAQIRNNVPQNLIGPQPPKRIDSLGLETKHLDLARYGMGPQNQLNDPAKGLGRYEALSRSDHRRSVKTVRSASSHSSGSVHQSHQNELFQRSGMFAKPKLLTRSDRHNKMTCRSSTPLTSSSSSRPSSVDLKDVGEKNKKNSILSMISSKEQNPRGLSIISSSGKENDNRPVKKSILSFKTASTIYARNKKPLRTGSGNLY